MTPSNSPAVIVVVSLMSIVGITASGHGQEHVWSRGYGGTMDDAPAHIVVDLLGNVYVCGAFDGDASFGGEVLTNAGDYDVFLAKYDAESNHLWSRRVGGSDKEVAGGLAVDDEGSVLISGYFKGTSSFGGIPFTSKGYSDVFLAKYTTDGAHVWSQQFGGEGADGGAIVAVDRGGNVLMAGGFRDTMEVGGSVLTSAGGDDIFLAKFDGAGAHLWSRRAGGGSLYDFPTDLVVDGSGFVAITGGMDFDFTAGVAGTAFVAKYDASGNPLWNRILTESDQLNWGYGVEVDRDGNVYVAGQFTGMADFGAGPVTSIGTWDLFVAKYGPEGAHRWSQSFGGGSPLGTALVGNWRYGEGDDGEHEDKDSADDDDGDEDDERGGDKVRILLTGWFWDPIDFGGALLSVEGSRDAFVVSFDHRGDHVWSTNFSAGPGTRSWGADLAVDPLGDVLITGRFNGVLNLGGDDLTSQGDLDMFLAKFRVQGDIVSEVDEGDSPFRSGPGSFVLEGNTPNPFNPRTLISYSLSRATGVHLRVLDVAGRLVQVLENGARREAGRQTVIWDGRNAGGRHVSSGVYFSELMVDGRRQTRKMTLLR